jgi:hypothetical protein
MTSLFFHFLSATPHRQKLAAIKTSLEASVWIRAEVYFSFHCSDLEYSTHFYPLITAYKRKSSFGIENSDLLRQSSEYNLAAKRSRNALTVRQAAW